MEIYISRFVLIAASEVYQILTRPGICRQTAPARTAKPLRGGPGAAAVDKGTPGYLIAWTVSSNMPDGVCTRTVSPTRLPIRAAPIGDWLEILRWRALTSAGPTIW